MKNSFLFSYLFLGIFVFLFSCNKDIDVVDSNVNVVELLSYTKTPCFGFCDAYSVSLLSDNTLFIKEIGGASLDNNKVQALDPESSINKLVPRSLQYNISKKVDVDFWKKIKDRAIKLNLHKLSKVYPEDGSIVMDISKTIIRIRLDEKFIEIEDSLGAPSNLIAFEAFVEAMINEVRGRKFENY